MEIDQCYGLTVICATLAVSQVQLVATEESPAQHDARMAWWREAKFGMFVHWGLHSFTGGEYQGQKLPNSAEWMMNRGKIPIAEYEQYAARFNPAGFDADTFVGLAKEAGMKYLVITAKHHDGFSMFASKASRYNVVGATPFRREIVKELSEACQRQGLRFGFYYSQAKTGIIPAASATPGTRPSSESAPTSMCARRPIPRRRNRSPGMVRSASSGGTRRAG